MVDAKEVKNQLTNDQVIKILKLLGTDSKERNALLVSLAHQTYDKSIMK